MKRILLLVIVSLATQLAMAQNAKLSGLVKDKTGAVIPAATVTLKNTQTAVASVVKTGSSGYFTFPSIMPGDYLLTVEQKGFSVSEITGIVLHTADSRTIEVTLSVGPTSQDVTVSAGSQTNDSPATSMTVTRDFIENMPLNGRSLQDLIQLAPGTASTNGFNGGYYSIDGQRADSNNYAVDGVSANLGGINNYLPGAYGSALSGALPAQTALGTTQSLASTDSLQEFKIQTSTYAAEYGRNPGGQVEFTTRSGTNDMHGTLFDYLRNTVFDANSYSNDYYHDPQTAEHQNDFGGTVSGPLIIPKLYGGRDRTFYFFSYEGLRLLLPAFESEYVPTQAFRNWASPNVQPFLNAVPLPNPSSPGNQDNCSVPDPATGQPTACDALFTYGYSYPNSLDNISIRLDYNLAPRLHGFVRFADTPSSEITGLEQSETESTHIYSGTAGLTAQITGTLINEFRLNYSHDEENQITVQKSIHGSIPFARNLVIPADYEGPFATGGPEIRIPGTSLRASPYWSGSGSLQRQLQLIDSLSWTKANHSLRIGADWRRLTPTYSSNPYDSFFDSTTLAAIQQGYATTLTVSAAEPGSPVFDNLSVYVEDQWKTRPRLTLSYGLRWEFNPPPGPSNGHYPITLTSDNLATAQLSPAGTQPYQTSWHSFAPRFGFAWIAVPSQKHPLTVRGGFGIFFDTGQTTIGNAYAGAYPFGASGPTLTNVPLPLSDAALAPPSLNFPLTPPYPELQGISSRNLTLPYTEQWSVSVDEALNVRNTLTASYVGNNGRKLLFTQFYSEIPGNPAFASGLQFTGNRAQSSYNALQVQDVGRIGPSLDLVGSFTLAHALDDASSDFSGFAPVYGNSDYDLRRILNLALTYQPAAASSNSGLRRLTGGWLLAPRFAAQSGYPFTVIQTYEVNPNGSEVEFVPDLIPGVPIYLSGSAADLNGQRVPGNWRLNRAAFAEVPTDPTTGIPVRQGTLGRNYLRNPSFWALNVALQRSFPIYEQLRLSFRVDAFNVPNHPNLQGPDSYLTDSTFGQLGTSITTIGSSNALYAMGAARSLQFSLKLKF